MRLVLQCILLGGTLLLPQQCSFAGSADLEECRIAAFDAQVIQWKRSEQGGAMTKEEILEVARNHVPARLSTIIPLLDEAFAVDLSDVDWPKTVLERCMR